MKALVRILATIICIFTLVGLFSSCENLDLEDILGSLEDETIPDLKPDVNPEGCAHLFGEWTVKRPAFCQHRDLERTCIICGLVEEREGSDEDHRWDEWKNVAPTCGDKGYDERICRLCTYKEVANETSPTGEHSYTTTTFEPTCTSRGYDILLCVVCSEVEYINYLDPTPHEFGYFIVDNQQHTSYCRHCNNRMDTDSHSFLGDGEICQICEYDKKSPAYSLNIWIPTGLGYTGTISAQIDRFIKEYYPNITVHLNLAIASPEDTLWHIQNYPDSAPDIFCVSQDSVDVLAAAGLISPISDEKSVAVRLENDKASVAAADFDGKLYAYPMTSDNGYYMYYDKSVISNPYNFESIIADCEAAGKKFRFDLENAWYTASFFMATGCRSDWKVELNGEFTGVEDNYNSESGLIAMKAMQKLTQSSAYEHNADIVDSNTAVWITGIWNDYYAIETFGENLGVSCLPTFNVDGVYYQLSSFSGHKLVAVSPHEDKAEEKFLHDLAAYITSAECQKERYDQDNYIPSNLEAQRYVAEKIPAIGALTDQMEYANPQSPIYSSWWDIARMLGIDSKNATCEDDLKTSLENYDKSINEVIYWFNKAASWSVIGSVQGSSWDTDFIMEDKGDNVWEIYMTLKAGEEFKIRKNLDWTFNFGKDGIRNGDNIFVPHDGSYIIKFTYLSEDNCTIELIAQN